jgi:glycosyltransferase involved in cell wall biosynthesis
MEDRQLVSIITVSRNSEDCIGKTMESVLRQTYDRMEYWIIDGASSDRTVAIAEGYREQFEKRGIPLHVISEPDGGTYDAMNKGVALAGGDVIGMINSGDWYEDDAVETAVHTMGQKGCDYVFGDIRIVKGDGQGFVKKARLRSFQTSRDWNHPTSFAKAKLYRLYPLQNKGIHDDYGFYLKIRKKGYKIETVPKVMANFQMGGASNHKSWKEAKKRISDRYKYCYRDNGYSRWYLVECVGIEVIKFILG